MKIFQALEQQLKKESNYVNDNGELKKWVVINKAQNFDADLIELLLENETLKKKFFVEVKTVLVFNQTLFIQFLEQKNYLNDSYTAYKNKIGLTIDGKYLKQRNEVALVWPFKDCILEGGQSREEDKRSEIFFNATLAQDEITQLLEPKVLTNAKRYTVKGEKLLNKFNRNEQGVITDNLIIKGNNLLALHSLKGEFAGKVKLVYIDPPYYFRENKQEDTFTYNSNFQLSTWLTFMENRIKSAYDLMTNDGVIFISINEDGLAYLKILLDDIFKIENFIEIFNWKKTDTPSNLPKKSKKATEYILCYEKKKDNVKYKGIEKTSASNDPLTKPKNSFKVIEFIPGSLICSDEKKTYSKGSNYGTEKYPMELLDDLIIENNTNINKIRLKNRFIWIQDNFNNELKNGTKLFCSKNSLVISYKKSVYEIESPFDLIDSSMGIQTTESAGNELSKIFGKEVFKYPKSESLIEYLINMVSNKFSEKDIILDFHIGSGTTAVTAHKMKLQYIGVEQIEEHIEITKQRLIKTIEGDQSGISQSVKWKGGGEFVYIELKKYNQTFIEQIETAKSSNALLIIWEEMKAKSFLNYNIDLQKQEEHIEEFKSLSLVDQKQHLVELLDKNQLYVNLSSLNDNDFSCTDAEKNISKDFYQIKK
jgi:adenine-specific DNA-methyltransferase